MSANDDYYRKQAAEAQRQASWSKNDHDKASWLRLVEGWLSLLPKALRTPEQKFDDQAKAQGTGQDTSKESQ